MYRSASRYDSRAIPEKVSRPGRASWEPASSQQQQQPQPQHRPYAATAAAAAAAAALEDDRGGLLRDPYLNDDGSERNYQRGGKGPTNGADFREAQRLAASFFSQYPAASVDAAYRDAARPTRPLSPEIAMERYPPRGQYRDRDVGVERWPPERSNPEALYAASSRGAAAPLVLEDWDDAADGRREPRLNLYGMAASRGRKRDDEAWDDAAEYEYNAARKDPNYGQIQPPADLDSNLRVTKRVDWTGLLRPEGGRHEDGGGLDALGKRVTTSYRGNGRFPYGDSYRDGLEEEFDAEGSSFYARRGGGFHGSERYRESEARKERAYFEERLPEYGLGGRGGGRGLKGKEDWRPDRDAGGGRGPRRGESERARDKVRYEERDFRRPFPPRSRYPSGGGSGAGADRVADEYGSFEKGRDRKYRPVRRERASITNQDILAVYYGNQGHGSHASKFGHPRRSMPYPPGPSRYHDDIRSEKYKPPLRRPSRSPYRGRPARYNPDLDIARKGKKRWEKSQVEGSEVKRFKRETQSDKLYLMHNSKATAEGKEGNSASGRRTVAEAEAEMADDKEERGKGEASEPGPFENAEKSADGDATASASAADAAAEKNDLPEAENGLWDGDTWSESEEEKHGELLWGTAPAVEEDPLDEGTGEQQRDEATFRVLQSGAVDDSKKFLGECSEDDEDDDADWESLASDLEDQLDDVCVHQWSAGTNAGTEYSHKEGMTLPNAEAQVSEGAQKIDTLSVTKTHDAVMADDGEDVDDNEDGEDGKEETGLESGGTEVREGGEKKVAEIMEELKGNVKNREDKAFDHYVSLFERDMDLMKLYEANLNCGSFECLVCAGVGAKKNKKFADVASLVQHAKKVLRTKKLPEHRGFARAVCQILGWESEHGPSVILPRGCIPPQSPKLNVAASGSPEKQKGGPTPVVMDWEWAAARQLFEAQEARIEVTNKSPELSASERVNATSDLHPSEGVNSKSAGGQANLVTSLQTTRGVDTDATTGVVADPILIKDNGVLIGESGTGKGPGDEEYNPEEIIVYKPMAASEGAMGSEVIISSNNQCVVEPASDAMGSVLELIHDGKSKSFSKSSDQPAEEDGGLAIGMSDHSVKDGGAGDDSTEA